MKAPYDVIIGLEVHVQLATKTKLFCSCSTEFGRPPNTQTCPVCLGMPGSLPVMNREAFALGLKTAVALNCTIPTFTKWDRKQYYYPDLPKNYQISQFDLPMSEKGFVRISDPQGAFEPKDIRLIRAHLEEDAGKSMHDEAAGKADSRIDLNRTGTPLLEIVSEPDMRSAEEAKAYLNELKLLLTYLGVSDCNMQEGSLRVDANINLHIHTDDGRIPTPLCEVKNMNSFRAVERAMRYEVDRQWEVWKESGVKMGDPGGHKTTRGWDEATQTTKEQRTKEESSDYRYFPDPDLVPVTVTAAEVDAVRAGLGELPAALRTRLESEYAITAYDADVLVNQGRALVDYFVELAQVSGDAKAAANWIQQDVLRYLNEREIGIADFPVTTDALGVLLKKVAAGKLTTGRGRDVLAQMLQTGQSVDEAMESLGIAEVDESDLETLCRDLLAKNPRVVQDCKEGKTKAIGALIGQAKKVNPNVNPGKFRETCLRLIETM